MSTEKQLQYNTISDDSEGYYEEKKSKFLCYLHMAETEEGALEFISKIKKKHYDARHNCSAMIIGSGKECKRSSDDGEPSGTAGKPMLEVLLGADITNVVCVVTRYFGGVLLGTGGLVKAYQSAVKDALQNAIDSGKIVKITYCCDIEIEIDYARVNALDYFLSNKEIKVIAKEYLQKVKYTVRVEDEAADETVDALTDLTNASANIVKLGTGYYPL